MAAWPASLPQSPLLDGFRELREANVLRTSVDVGPAKVRPRYTTDLSVFAMGFVLTDAQLATFDTFYTETIFYGAEAFDWTHPRTGSAISGRLRPPPQITALGAGLWSVFFELEILT